MWEDPVVEEVHRIRETLAAEHNFDIKAIFADLRKRQAALGGRLVHPKKQTEPIVEAGQGRPFNSLEEKMGQNDSSPGSPQQSK